MTWQSDFYGSVYSTAKELGATDTQAHLAAAQASQETGYGQHVVGNNYFGVKASPSYTGDTVTANTSEGEDAVSNRMDQSFRAYDGLKASVANYMDVMANAFPDAWNAPNIADAAKGLVSGKFGRYAKDINYPGKIQSIANKLGAQQKYAYAQEPENVPVPYGPEDDPLANSQQAQAIDGLSGVVNPVSTQEVTSSELSAPGEWGINNGVAPALTPTVEGWSAMADAPPIRADISRPAVDNWSDLITAGPMAITPSYNVPATASLQANPGMLASAMANPVMPAQTPEASPLDGFTEMATAGPFGVEYASPESRMGPSSASSISQADVDRALANITSQDMDPSFTAGLMSPQNPVVPNAVETSSYTPDQPMPTPSLGSFPDAMAAQRMPATGIYSPEHLAMQAQVERQLADVTAKPAVTNPALAAPNFTQALSPSLPSLSVPTVGMSDPQIASAIQSTAIPGINAYATQPTDVAPAEQAIADITNPTSLSPSQIAGYQQAAQTMAQAGMLNIGQQPPTDLSGNLPTNFNVLSAPALDSISIPDQPSVVAAQPALDGPTTTPAVTQQAVTATQPASTTQNKGLTRGLLSKETLAGGVLGGMALGPIGGILGALIGQQVARNGLSSSPNTTTSGGFLGYGPAASYAVYGGGVAPGSSAIASDGSRVTSKENGDVSRTNTFGVTDTANSYGGYAGDFSGFF